MKKNIILTGMMLLASVAMSAQGYNMVVDKTDGTKVTIPISSISQVTFQQDGGDTPSGTGTFQGAKRVFGDNLMKKYAYQSSSSSNGKSWDYTYDSNGYITRADYADGYSSSYATIDYSGGSVVVFKSFDKADGSLISQAVINIGSNGYASSYSYTDDKGRANKIDLTYNSDEQITNIVCYRNGAKSWGYSFEYSDGDLVKATELGWENDVLTDNEVCANILYETSTQSKIDNVGGVMEYDHMMHIDCGLDRIFQIGALGKPSKHLPLLVTWGSSTINNSYTLDSAGRPTSATSARTSSSGSTSTYNITWAW